MLLAKRLQTQCALAFFILSIPLVAFGQGQSRVRARDLFLSGSDQTSGSSKNGAQQIGAKSDKTMSTPRPLGLRYSILKQVGGQTVEVDPESVFHSGDRIRLSVQANDTGFLYIVLRGSSGKWTPLFPSKEIMSGNNKVERGGSYEIPLGSVWFAFDEQAGTERLFIVLARQPEPDFEKLVQALRQDTPQEAAKTTPATPAADEGSVQVVSSLDDATVGKVRGQVRSRDLVFEKVDDSSPVGAKSEKAIYVVNRTGNSDSKVVVDVSLNHQ